MVLPLEIFFERAHPTPLPQETDDAIKYVLDVICTGFYYKVNILSSEYALETPRQPLSLDRFGKALLDINQWRSQALRELDPAELQNPSAKEKRSTIIHTALELWKQDFKENGLTTCQDEDLKQIAKSPIKAVRDQRMDKMRKWFASHQHKVAGSRFLCKAVLAVGLPMFAWEMKSWLVRFVQAFKEYSGDDDALAARRRAKKDVASEEQRRVKEEQRRVKEELESARKRFHKGKFLYKEFPEASLWRGTRKRNWGQVKQHDRALWQQYREGTLQLEVDELQKVHGFGQARSDAIIPQGSDFQPVRDMDW